MDYINIAVLQDSIETSIALKFFKNKKDSSFAHIFNSKIIKMQLSAFNNINNFNPGRLQKTPTKAYPINDRPRGNRDISSVKFYQKQLQDKKELPYIWLINKDGKYTLLDGAHRIVASYIEDKKYIYAYLVDLDK